MNDNKVPFIIVDNSPKTTSFLFDVTKRISFASQIIVRSEGKTWNKAKILLTTVDIIHIKQVQGLQILEQLNSHSPFTFDASKSLI